VAIGGTVALPTLTLAGPGTALTVPLVRAVKAGTTATSLPSG
jgi:hypothetical protein